MFNVNLFTILPPLEEESDDPLRGNICTLNSSQAPTLFSQISNLVRRAGVQAVSADRQLICNSSVLDKSDTNWKPMQLDPRKIWTLTVFESQIKELALISGVPEIHSKVGHQRREIDSWKPRYRKSHKAPSPWHLLRGRSLISIKWHRVRTREPFWDPLFTQHLSTYQGNPT